MGKKVSRDNAIAVLVATPTIKAAAARIGVAEKTVHAWLKDPAFSEALGRAQAAMTRDAIRQVLQAVGSAVAVLEAIMTDTAHPPMPRVVAAKAILENALKVYDLEEVMRRLEALERRYDEV
jgi:hypothetical protein